MPLDLGQVRALHGDARARQLIQLLRESTYSLTAIADLCGESDRDSLITNTALSAMAYDEVLRDDGSALACLARLFLLGCHVEDDHYRVLSTELRALIEALGFVRIVDDKRRVGEVAIGELDSTYLISDNLIEFDGEEIEVNEAQDVVWPTTEWSQVLRRRLVKDPRWSRLLDVGCGNGCVSLLLRHSYSSITGIDLNPRAVALSSLNAALAGAASVRYSVADCLEFRDTPFDHIVFVAPGGPGGGDGAVMVSDGGRLGHELLVRFLAERVETLLSPHGACQAWGTFAVEERDGSVEALLAHALPDRFSIAFDADRHGGLYLSPDHIRTGTVPAGCSYLQAKRDGKGFLAGLRDSKITEVVSGVVTLRFR